MAKIYASFEELLEQNKSVFDFILKKGHRELLRACWDAREGQVSEFKQQVATLSQQINSLSKQVNVLDEKLDDERIAHEATCKNFQNEIDDKRNENQKLNLEVTDAQNYIIKLQEFSQEMRELAEREKAHMQEVEIENQTLLESEKEHLAKIAELTDYIEGTRVDVEKSLKYAEKVREVVEKSNVYAEESSKEAIKAKQESENLRKLANEKEEKFEMAQGQLGILQNDLENIRLSFETMKDEAARYHKKFQEINQNLVRTQSDLTLEKKLSDKLAAELEEAKLMSERLQDKSSKLISENQQIQIYVEELEVYTQDLRNENQQLRASALKSQSNLEKLRDYSEKLEISFEREQSLHRETIDYSKNLEESIEKAKKDHEYFKSEVIRLNDVLNNIQSSLGQVTEMTMQKNERLNQ